MPSTRREFLALTAAARLAAAKGMQYHIGITSNTRGGWENDVFLSFREAREVGYRWVESFIQYFWRDYLLRGAPGADDLQKKVEALGLRFVTISNSGPMEMHFEDPAKHEKIIEEHLRLVRFIKLLGCDHLKINTGARHPEGTSAEDLKQIASVLNAIGRRTSAEGLKFAFHAHMWSQLENRREIDFVLSHTNPRDVWFVLDTGQITMAGMDPVALARTLGSRVIEYHLKDVKPENRGGAKHRVAHHEPMTHPLFFPLGEGGVDFPALMGYLNDTSWRGWLTVELDSSPFQPPKESARISRDYLEKKLHLDLTV
ncbi:MAG: sugar phosphate isomerase/epimerase [Bryobacteraceae bacterium]